LERQNDGPPDAQARAPLDQRLARVLVRPLAGTAVTPNQLTFLCLAVGLVAALCLAIPSPTAANIGTFLFMLAVFLDHTDGELARMTGQTSELGHRLDYLVGSAIYTAMFIGGGTGLYGAGGPLWVLFLGIAAGLINIPTVYLRLKLDLTYGAEAVAHPRFGLFELEDFIYLIGPATWLGGFSYFFPLFAVGSLGYFGWTCLELYRHRKAGR